jgi:photosystem II stability/assembly factor-like uncharacterized protein
MYLFFLLVEAAFLERAAVASADPGWSWQNPLPQGAHLGMVAFATPDTAVALGHAATVLRSTDEGRNWTIVHQDSTEGTSFALGAVSFVTEKIGIAVGGFGDMQRTTDAGLTWMSVSLPERDVFSSIAFSSESDGFVVGGHTLLRTMDGGISWTAQRPVTQGRLSMVAAPSPEIAVAGGEYGEMQRSTDGGKTWSMILTGLTGADNELVALAFRPPQHGFAVIYTRRYGEVFITTDDGFETWTPPKPIGVRLSFRSASYIGPKTIVGLTTQFVRSDDDGATWIEVPLPDRASSTYDFRAVAFADDQNGIIVGSYGLIYRTEDGGMHWISESPSLRAHLNDVHFTDVDVGTAVGANGTILRTVDGGDSWFQQDSGTEINLIAVAFATEKTGWAVGNGTFLRTTDGGANWLSRSMQLLPSSLSFVDESNGWIAEDSCCRPRILHTTDGGENWSIVEVESPIRAIQFLNPKVGFAAGFRSIFRSDDGGGSWRTVYQGSLEEDLSSLSFIDQSIGYVCGRRLILKTTDGGATWSRTEFDLRTEYSCNAISFVDAFDGMVLSPGRVLRTTDGGENWSPQNSRGALPAAISRPTGDVTTVVGYGGAILRTTTAGVETTANGS